MNEKEKLKEDIVCPNCETNLKLTEHEQESGKFACPNCDLHFSYFKEQVEGQNKDVGKEKTMPEKSVNQTNSPDGMIPVADFAQDRGINEEKVIEMIKDGFYVGRIIDGNWYVSQTEQNKANSKEENPSKSLFSLEGRIKRGAFWAIIITLFLISAGLQLAVALSADRSAPGGLAIVALIFFIPSIWVAFATYVKRWHDLNKSGWMVLTLFIPFLNFLVILYLGLAPGTVGSNKYGEAQ